MPLLLAFGHATRRRGGAGPRRIGVVSLFVVGVLSSASGARALAAQSCVTHTGEQALGHLAGLRVDSILIETSPPRPLRGIDRAMRLVHAQTRASTIRRLITVVANSPVDTLQLAESLRALRRARFLADASLDASECRERASVRLTFRTLDAWSTRGSVRVASARSAASLEELNLLGTGRSAKMSLRSDAGQLGIGLQYVDPWALGTRLGLAVSRNAFRAGSEWSAALRTAPRSVFDAWRGELLVANSRRFSVASRNDVVVRSGAALFVERRAMITPSAVTSVVFGAELQRASLAAGSTSALIGPATVSRRFAALDIGATRRSVSYRTVAGLLGSERTVELPSGYESDVLLGFGRDIATGSPMQHIDAWAGKLWFAPHHAIVSTNVWASGYRSRGEWSAGDARVSLLAIQPVKRGQWLLRGSAETLLDPDPDVRALSAVDPTARMFAARGLAETATALSLERDVHLRGIGASYMLDAAIFGLGSRRWDAASASAPEASAGVGVLGVGLRLSPLRIARATIRFDVGWPVLRSPGISKRPMIGLGISPWLETERRRAARPPT